MVLGVALMFRHLPRQKEREKEGEERGRRGKEGNRIQIEVIRMHFIRTQ